MGTPDREPVALDPATQLEGEDGAYSALVASGGAQLYSIPRA